MGTTHHFVLSVLVLRDDDVWIAQGLEHDFAAQGQTPEAALHALRRTILGHFRVASQDAPFANVPQAPQQYWDIWSRATALAAPKPLPLTESDVNVPPAWMLAAQSNDNHVH